MPSLILAQGIGRWGNFVNQEAYGNLITDPGLQYFPYAVNIESAHFTELARQQCIDAFGSVPASAWFNATFFYESMVNLLICLILFLILRKVDISGIAMCGYFVLYGIARLIIEGFRTDSLMWGSVRVSQLLSALLIAFGLGFATYLVIKHIKGKRVNKLLEE